MLKNIFGPKWQHADPLIRKKAVMELTDDEKDILAQILNSDPDEDIRLLALGKIRDEIEIETAAGSNSNAAVRGAATEKLQPRYQQKIETETDEVVAFPLLDKIIEENRWVEIAYKARLVSVREKAVEKVNAPALLLEILSRECGLRPGLSVIDKLNDPELLDQAAGTSANRKIRRAAAKKAELLRGKEAEPDIAEPIAEPPVFSISVPKTDRKVLPEDTDVRKDKVPETDKTMEDETVSQNNVEQATVISPEPEIEMSVPKKEEILKCEETAEKKERRKPEARKEPEKDIERLNALCRKLEEAVIADKRLGLDKRVRDIQKQWEDLGRKSPDERRRLQPKYDQLCRDFHRKQTEFWEQRKWELWANLKKKEALCEEAESLIKRKDMGGIANIARDLRIRWRETGPVDRKMADAIWERFSQACDHVHGRCLKYKKLLDRELDKVLADETFTHEMVEKIKAIQNEWNRVGLLPKPLEADQATVFWGKCNGYFERRRNYFNERDRIRKANLEQKKQLCEMVEALSDSTDWIRTREKLKSLQKEWKRIGPAPMKQSRAVWQRFRGACDVFFERLEAEKPRNLEAKIALCEEVEALVGGLSEEKTPDAAARRIIDIQKEWKKIGPVPIEADDDIWVRFRKPCDAFFEKRKMEKLAEKEIREQNREKKESLIARAGEVSDSGDFKETAEALKDLQKQWAAVDSAGWKDDKLLWGRFREVCDGFFTRRNAHFDALRGDREKNYKRKEALCLDIEMLNRLLAPSEDGAEVEGVNMAEQLSAAMELRNNVLVAGNQIETRHRAMDKVRAIQDAWKAIGPVPHAEDRVLYKRFREALDRFYAARRGKPASKHQKAPS